MCPLHYKVVYMRGELPRRSCFLALAPPWSRKTVISALHSFARYTPEPLCGVVPLLDNAVICLRECAPVDKSRSGYELLATVASTHRCASSRKKGNDVALSLTVSSKRRSCGCRPAVHAIISKQSATTAPDGVAAAWPSVAVRHGQDTPAGLIVQLRLTINYTLGTAYSVIIYAQLRATDRRHRYVST